MAGRLLILFIALPIVELWLLIKIGGLIGVLPTIALVIATAIVGSQLVRRQGLTAIQRIQAAQRRGETPALQMLDGAALLIAGFMLLTPGFISDAFGFVLLIPGLRERIARRLLARVTVVSARPGGERDAGRGQARRRESRVIEGDYRRGPNSANDHPANDRKGRDERGS